MVLLSTLPTNLVYKVSATLDPTLTSIDVNRYIPYVSDLSASGGGTQITTDGAVNWVIIESEDWFGALTTADYKGQGEYFGLPPGHLGYLYPTAAPSAFPYGTTGFDINAGVTSWQVTAFNDYLLHMEAVRPISSTVLNQYFLTSIDTTNKLTITAKPGAPSYGVMGFIEDAETPKPITDFTYLNDIGDPNFPFISGYYAMTGFTGNSSISSRPVNLLVMDNRDFSARVIDLTGNHLFFHLTTRNTLVDDPVFYSQLTANYSNQNIFQSIFVPDPIMVPSAQDVSAMTITISAIPSASPLLQDNSQIYWRATRNTGAVSPQVLGAIVDRPPTGEYVNCPNAFNFVDSTGCVGSGLISLTAGKDTESIFVTLLCAIGPAATATSSVNTFIFNDTPYSPYIYADHNAGFVEFKPKRVQIELDEYEQIGDTGYAILSAIYIDTDGAKFPIDAGDVSNLTWVINNTASLEAGHGFSPGASNNTQIGVDQISLSSTVAVNKTLTAYIDDQYSRTPYIQDLFIKDGIAISAYNAGPNLFVLPVYEQSQIPIASVSPTRQFVLSTDASGPEFTPNGGSASIPTQQQNAGYWTSPHTELTTDTLTGTWQVVISSGLDQSTYNWRPYLTFDSTSELDMIIQTSTQDSDSIEYEIQTFGRTGTPLSTHNLQEGTTVNYTHTGDRLGLNPSIQSSIIIKPDFAWEIDVPSEFYTGGPYQTINDTVSALANPSGSITFTTEPIVGDDIFLPVFRVDTNTATPLLYLLRPASISLSANDINDTTIAGGDLLGGFYEFSSPELSLSDSGSFTTESDLRTKQVASVAVPPQGLGSISSANITFSVSALYGSSPGSLTVKTYSTSTVFIDCDPITDTDVVIIPEYKWNSTPTNTWERVININTFALESTPVVSAYGHGRTETLVLSARDIPCIGSWKWELVSNSGDRLIDNSAIGTSRITTYNWKSSAQSNEDIDIIVTPCTVIGNVALAPFTASNKFRFVYDDPNDILIDVTYPSEYRAPGVLQGSVSATNNPGPAPIKFQTDSVRTNIFTPHWTASALNVAPGAGNLTETQFNFTVSDIGQTVLSIPKFRSTSTSICSVPTYKYSYYTHPRHNDWFYPSNFGDSINSTIQQQAPIVGWPVIPYYYLNNKYIELSGEVPEAFAVFANETVWLGNPFLSGFEWTSNAITSSFTSPDDFIGGPYTEESIYDISVTSLLNDLESFNTSDSKALVVLDQYPEYDPEINRRVNDFAPLELEPCGIGSNEWLTHDNINLAMKKVFDNIEGLTKASKIYDDPPFEYLGWFGAINYSTSGSQALIPQLRWWANQTGLEYKFSDPSACVTWVDQIPLSFSASEVRDIIVQDNEMWFSTGSGVFLLSDGLLPTLITGETEVGIGQPFNNIRTIQLDNVDENRIYLLDSIDPYDNSTGSKNRVYVFQFERNLNAWLLLFNWGGLGSAASNYTFQNPGDMLLDDDNLLYIADTDNLVIKKFTRTGSHLKTIYNANFSATNKPISLCQTTTGEIHVLCNNMVVVIDTEGNELRTYNINTSSTYTRIRPSQNDGFLYIMSESVIIKSTFDGELQLTLQYYELDPSFTPKHRAVYQDEFRNLYVPQQNTAVLKFNDQIKLLSLIDDASIINRWAFDEISIDKQEYVQDWVLNKAINRLWDNIEILRRSVIGKLSFKRNLTVTDSESVVTDPPPPTPEQCLIDWIPGSTEGTITTDVFCYVTPTIRAFLPGEYKEPEFAKDEVIIGINELVTADVINRVLCQLQANIDSVYEMLSQPNDKSTELCDDLTPDVETIPDTIRQSLTACYPEYNQYF